MNSFIPLFYSFLREESFLLKRFSKQLKSVNTMYIIHSSFNCLNHKIPRGRATVIKYCTFSVDWNSVLSIKESQEGLDLPGQSYCIFFGVSFLSGWSWILILLKYRKGMKNHFESFFFFLNNLLKNVDFSYFQVLGVFKLFWDWLSSCVDKGMWELFYFSHAISGKWMLGSSHSTFSKSWNFKVS